MWLLPFVFVLLYIVYWFINDKFLLGKTIPPGPFRVPVLGTLSVILGALKKNPEIPYEAFKSLAKKYGPIFSIKGGLVWQVIVDDPEIIKEVLVGEEWSDRLENAYILDRSWGEPMGVLFGNGESWKELRRFSIRTLRDFGFGKQKSQEILMDEELSDLLRNLNEKIKNENGLVEMNQFFTVSVLNILWSMMAGSRFTLTDPKLNSLIRNLSQLMTTISVGGNLVMAFPFSRHIFKLFPGNAKLRVNIIKKLQHEFQTILNERRVEGYYKEDQRDFIDVFLMQIEKEKEKGNAGSVYNDKQFISTVFDFFTAGSETTANTLEFGILYMMLNPHVQKKVQDEIDQVIGRSRFPITTDRANMPYTEATIHEIQRLGNIVPMIGRSSSVDTKLRGYNISKDTHVILNTQSAHTNPLIWNNPEIFDPERFLNSQNQIINADKLFVFGTGRRVCVGELMARATLFSYFSTMLQNYTFEVPPNLPKPTAQPRFGLTMSPFPYTALIKPRPF